MVLARLRDPTEVGMTSKIIAALGIWLALAAPAEGQAAPDTIGRSVTPVREVRQASAALDRALERGDTAALARLYADGYVHVDQFGVRTGKAERLAELGRGTRRFQAVGVAVEPQYAIFGDVVVATARTNGQQTVDGSAVRQRPRMSTRVWVRRDGRWQVILAQTTPIDRP
jgi:ketosteroid isomerase-like protein